MKKSLKTLFLLLLALSILSACQQTPDEPIVVGRDLEVLIEKAAQNDGATGGSIRQRLGAPETYQADFTGADGLLRVAVDAAVAIPEAQTAPILRISSASVTQEQADAIIRNLTHAALYDPYEIASSRDALMRRILEAKERLMTGPSGEDGDMTYYDGRGNAISWEDWMQAHIDELTRAYEDAEAKPDASPISGRFETDGSGLYLIEGQGCSDEWGYESVQIHHGQGLGNSRALYAQNDAGYDGFSMDYELPWNLGRLSGDIDASAIPDILISVEEAKHLCDGFAAKMGLDSMQCDSALKKYGGRNLNANIPPRCCWVLQYTRAIDGIPITYTSAAGNAIFEGDVCEPWKYETLTFYVNDRGIVGMCWDSPYALGETLVQDARLLAFDEAMAVFEKMYSVKNAGIQADVKIAIIRFGYARITEQNRGGSALLVPAWDFFGIVIGGNGAASDDPEQSLLTVNAVDGSIVERERGY